MSIINADSGATSSLTALIKSSDGTANLTLQTQNINAVVIDANQNVKFATTGAVKIPAGTTAQRPSSPVNGMIRYNTDNTQLNLEGYANGSWVDITANATYVANYVIVAGGGGGGASGGGAGGMLTGTYTLTKATAYPVVIGAGGTLFQYGSNTTALGFTAIGGGKGNNASNPGGNGGSGGGGSGSGAVGSGTVGQGSNGGSGAAGVNATGGGGGKTGTGGASSGSVGGNGGTGGANPISGSTTGQLSGGTYYLAGGGGGGAYQGTSGTGGLGGGGNGGSMDGLPGTANTGGGGGGGAGRDGASGGSGVVILSVPTAKFSNTYANATITTSGANTIITFTTSGTYTA